MNGGQKLWLIAFMNGSLSRQRHLASYSTAEHFTFIGQAEF